jgi:hypothetical protein
MATRLVLLKTSGVASGLRDVPFPSEAVAVAFRGSEADRHAAEFGRLCSAKAARRTSRALTAVASRWRCDRAGRSTARASGSRPIRKPGAARMGDVRLPPSSRCGTVHACRRRRTQQADRRPRSVACNWQSGTHQLATGSDELQACLRARAQARCERAGRRRAGNRRCGSFRMFLWSWTSGCPSDGIFPSLRDRCRTSASSSNKNGHGCTGRACRGRRLRGVQSALNDFDRAVGARGGLLTR